MIQDEVSMGKAPGNLQLLNVDGCICTHEMKQQRRGR